MNRVSIITVAAALLAAPACMDDASTRSLELAVSEGPIAAAGSGHWRIIGGCSAYCFWTERFWIDLDVRNDAYDKRVAVLWTSNGWATVNVAEASYEADAGNGRETWGVDVVLGQYSDPNPPPREVEYAAFVEMNGQTHWEPYNNHYIYGSVGFERPVRLLDSEVSYDATAGGVLTGSVRVFDLDYAKQVTVVYTTDGWATASEAEAQWDHGDDWAFRVEGLGGVDGEPLPDEVVFAVRYRVLGAEHWDNHDGDDFRHRLAPAFDLEPLYSFDGFDEPVSGVITASARVSTDIGVAAVDARVDDGAWVTVDSSYTSNYTFTTLDLDDGAHAVEFRATLAGGYQATAGRSVEVDNRISPLGAWAPTFAPFDPDDPGSRGSSWGLAAGDDGSIYFQWEERYQYPAEPYRGIARFDQYGSSASPLLYEALAPTPSGFPPYFWRVAVDEAGRVYALERSPGTAVWRWRADGTIDTDFADGGRLELETEWNGHRFDIVRAMAWGGDSLWIVGTCPAWNATCGASLNRFDADGAFLGAAAIPEDLPNEGGYSVDPGAAVHDGATLWVLQGRTIVGFDAGADGAPALAGTVELDVAVSPEAIVRLGDGRFFVQDGGRRLVALDADGAVAGHWYFGNDSAEYLGGVDLASEMVLVGDTVVVLDVEAARAVSFDTNVE